MKYIYHILLLTLFANSNGVAQDLRSSNENKQQIIQLIADYAQARESKDSLTLSLILTKEVDQLVSSGIWRKGKSESLSGMMRSSQNNPGSRRLIVDQVRLVGKEVGIADARYEIHQEDGEIRKMWSTFVVVFENNRWKISGIRNMLPASGR